MSNEVMKTAMAHPNRLCVLVVCLIAACSSLRTNLQQAEESLSAGYEERAVVSYSYSIMQDPPESAQKSLAKMRGDPKLQSALEARLQQIWQSTIIGQTAREQFLVDFPKRLEVLAYFRIKQLDAAQREDFIQKAYQTALAFYAEWNKERDAEERRQRVEAERRRAAEIAAEANLIAEARAGSKYKCLNELECRKAFALTQIYVSTESDMKIQLATDTIIETYNPTDVGKMGAKAIKLPGSGETAEIQLTVTCRDCSAELRKGMYQKMKDFRTYIEKHIRQ